MLLFFVILCLSYFLPMELHHVRDACQTKALRSQAKRRRKMDIPPCLAASPVHAFMQLSSGGREEILAPNALNMNERTLPRAEQIVLQRGKHHWRFF